MNKQEQTALLELSKELVKDIECFVKAIDRSTPIVDTVCNCVEERVSRFKALVKTIDAAHPKKTF